MLLTPHQIHDLSETIIMRVLIKGHNILFCCTIIKIILKSSSKHPPCLELCRAKSKVVTNADYNAILDIMLSGHGLHGD